MRLSKLAAKQECPPQKVSLKPTRNRPLSLFFMAVQRRRPRPSTMIATPRAHEQAIDEVPEPRMNARIAFCVAAALALLSGVAVLYTSSSPAPASGPALAVPSSSTSKGRDTRAMLDRAEKYLSIADVWDFEPIPNIDAARAYIRDHPRFSKHVSAFTQVI